MNADGVIPPPPMRQAPRRIDIGENETETSSTRSNDSGVSSLDMPTISNSSSNQSSNASIEDKIVSEGPKYDAPRSPRNEMKSRPISSEPSPPSTNSDIVPKPPPVLTSIPMSYTPPSSPISRPISPPQSPTVSIPLSTSSQKMPPSSPLSPVPPTIPLVSTSSPSPQIRTRVRASPSIAYAAPSPTELKNYYRIKPLETVLDIFQNDSIVEVQKLSEIVNDIYSLRSQIVERSKHNFSLERHISQLDSSIQLLLQNQVRGTDREKTSLFTKIFGQQNKDKLDETLQERFRLQKHQRILLEELFYVLRNRPKLVALLSQFVTKDNNPAVQTFSQFIIYELYGDQYDEREENLLLEIFSFGLDWEFRQCTDRNTLMRGNSVLTHMMTSFAKRGQGLAILKSVLQKTVSTIYRSIDLNFEFNPDNVYREWCKDNKKPAVILKSEAIMLTFSLQEVHGETQPLIVTTEGEKGGEDVELPVEVIKTVYARRTALLTHSNDILEAMYASASQLPRGIRAVCRTMVQLLKTHFLGISEASICTLVGGFLCLRFFCPAIINSTILGLEPSKSSVTRRNLINVTKLIQCISNGSYRDNDAHMRFCDEFIQSHIPRMQKYIQEVVQVEDVKDSLVLTHFLEHADHRDNMLKTSLGTVHFMHGLLRQNLPKFEDLIRQAADVSRQSRIIDTQGSLQMMRNNGGRNSIRASTSLLPSPGSQLRSGASNVGKLAAISETANKPVAPRARAQVARPKFFRRESVLGGSMGMTASVGDDDEDDEDIFNEEAYALDSDCDCDCECSCTQQCECQCSCGCECGYGFDDDEDDIPEEEDDEDDGFVIRKNSKLLSTQPSSPRKADTYGIKKHLVRNRVKNSTNDNDSEMGDPTGGASWNDTVGDSSGDVEVSVYRPPRGNADSNNSTQDGLGFGSLKRKNKVLSKSGVPELLELMELLKPSTIPDETSIKALMNETITLRLIDPSLREKKSPAEVDRQNSDSLLAVDPTSGGQDREKNANARRERQERVREMEAEMERNAIENSGGTTTVDSTSDFPQRGRSLATSTPRKAPRKGFLSLFRKDRGTSEDSFSSSTNNTSFTNSDSDSSSMKTDTSSRDRGASSQETATKSSVGFASDTQIYAKLLALLPLLPHPSLLPGLYTNMGADAAGQGQVMGGMSFSTPRAPPSACIFFKYLRLSAPYLRRTADKSWDPQGKAAKASLGSFDPDLPPSARVSEVIFLLRALCVARDSGISLSAQPDEDVPFYGPDGAPRGKLSTPDSNGVVIESINAEDIEDWVYIRTSNVGFIELRVAGWMQRWSQEALIRDALLRDTSSTLAKVRDTLNVLEVHTKRLDDRLDMYEIYVESCRRGGAQSIVKSELAERPSLRKDKKRGDDDKVGVLKQFQPRVKRFSHNDLVAWRVIVKTRTPVSPSKLRYVNYIVTEIAAGQFTIMASFSKPLDFRILTNPIVLDLEDLLIREEEARLAFQLRDAPKAADAKKAQKPVSLYELDRSVVIDVCRFLHKVIRKYFTQ